MERSGIATAAGELLSGGCYLRATALSLWRCWGADERHHVVERQAVQVAGRIDVANMPALHHHF